MERDPETRPLTAIVLLLLLGMALRATFLLFPQSAIDSDNALYGLMATHITEGEFPLFTYGQHYMGALESYVAALFFLLFGVSGHALKLSPYLFSILFLAAVYLLGTELYGRKPALWAMACAAAGPPTLLVWSSAPRGGYSETLFFGTVLLWLALRIIRREGGKAWEWAALGVAAGLGFWTHFLIVYYLLPVAAVLAWSLGRNMFHPRTLAGAAAFFGGSLPFWIYNIPRGFVSLRMEAVGTGSAGETLERFFTLQLPELLHLTAKHFDRIPVIGRVWLVAGGGFYLILALLFLRRAIPSSLAFLLRRRRTPGEGIFLVFLLVLLFFFTSSRFGAFNTSRYLLPLYSVIPFLGAGFLARAGRVGGTAVKVLLCTVMAANVAFHVYSVSRELPQARAMDQFTGDLVRRMGEVGATEGISAYWLGWRFNFLTGEKIVFSEPVNDRYLPYQLRVESSPRPAFLIRTASGLPDALEERGVTFRADRFNRVRLLSGIRTPKRGLVPLDRHRWTVSPAEAGTIADGIRKAAPGEGGEGPGIREFTVDLGRKAVPALARVVFRGEQGTLPGEWRVSSSLDGKRWREVLHHTALEHVFVSGPRVYDGGMFFRSELLLDPSPARYLSFERSESLERDLMPLEEIFLYESDGAAFESGQGITGEVLDFIRREDVDLSFADRWESAELVDALGRERASVPWNGRHHPQNLNGIVPTGRKIAFILPLAEADRVREVLTPAAILKEKHAGAYEVLIAKVPGEGPSGLFWTGFSLLYDGPAGRAIWLRRLAARMRTEGRDEEAASLLREAVRASPRYYLPRLELAETLSSIDPPEGRRVMEGVERDFLPRTPVDVRFEKGVRLLGVDVESTEEGLQLTYRWSFDEPVGPGTWVFSHISVDGEEFQDDHPLAGSLHRHLLGEGNIIREVRVVEGAPAGGREGVDLSLGLWLPGKGRRFRVERSDRPVRRNSVRLGGVGEGS